MTTLTLEQRREIDLAKEQLVEKAEKLLDDAQIVKLRDKKFGHSQLRNLSAVASETESPAVVANFIRYQMGRDNKKTPEDWNVEVVVKGRHTRVGTLFLDELGGEKGAISMALAGVSGCPVSSVEQQLARMELIRHFIGFASRYLKFLDLQRKDKSGGNGEEHS